MPRYFPGALREAKEQQKMLFNFTFSDVEVIGGYVLYTPMRAEESKYSNKDFKRGSLSFFTAIEKIYLPIRTSVDPL